MPRAGAAERNRGQSGQSLIEVIVAIVLMSSVFTVIAAALLTVVFSTATNENKQIADAAIVSYGEILQTQVPYYACPTPPSPYSSFADAYYFASDPLMTSSNSATTPLWRRPNNVQVEVVAVKSFNTATEGWASGCLNPDPGIQLVQYRVTVCKAGTPGPSCESPTVRTAEVVKRKEGPS